MIKKMSVVALLLLCCVSVLAQTPPFVRTVVVSPVPNDPVASGNALMTAYGAITGADQDNRWLVKVEPGEFDLQSQQLFMSEWVSIQGSGVGATVVKGTGGSSFRGVINGADNTEISELSVLAEGESGNSIIVALSNASASPHITDVAVRVTPGDAVDMTCVGIGNYETSGATIERSSVSVTCTNGSFAYGVDNNTLITQAYGPAVLTIRDINVSVGGASLGNYGIFNDIDNVPYLLRNTIVTVSGGSEATAFTYGYAAVNRTLYIEGCHFVAWGAETARGVVIKPARTGKSTPHPISRASINKAVGAVKLYVSSSKITAWGLTDGDALVDETGFMHLTMDNSEAVANDSSATGWYKANIGGARLTGGVSATVEKCFGVFSNSAFFANTCP